LTVLQVGRCVLTTDRADEIIDELGVFLEEIRMGAIDPMRLMEISTELEAIESELDIGEPVAQ